MEAAPKALPRNHTPEPVRKETSNSIPDFAPKSETWDMERWKNGNWVRENAVVNYEGSVKVEMVLGMDELEVVSQ